MIFKRSSPATEGLTLKIGDHGYSFNSPAEFEFALAGRTCVPAARIAALVDVRDEDLLEEAAAIKQAERTLAGALSSALENSSKINDVFKEMDLTLISNDNDWRTIMFVLMVIPASYERYKKIALVKYIQYLVSRQEIVKGLYRHRQIHKKSGTSHDDPGAQSDSNPKETAMFEYATFRTDSGEAAEYKRMPKGETLEISLEPEKHFTFFVARQKCAIMMRDRPLFIDAAGREFLLRDGKSIVGRDVEADIVLESKFRDVSRKHLIIECNGTNVVRMTDISSHGTWVHSRGIESAGA